VCPVARGPHPSAAALADNADLVPLIKALRHK
jgi:hypothetical protein